MTKILLFLSVISVFYIARWLCREYLRKIPQKYHKYHGFIYAFVWAYLLMLSLYFSIFGCDFSYWYYITPFNVLILDGIVSIGCMVYLKETKEYFAKKDVGSVYVVIFSIIFIIGYSILCAKLKEWFGWDLNFLFFPWKV